MKSTIKKILKFSLLLIIIWSIWIVIFLFSILIEIKFNLQYFSLLFKEEKDFLLILLVSTLCLSLFTLFLIESIKIALVTKSTIFYKNFNKKIKAYSFFRNGEKELINKYNSWLKLKKVKSNFEENNLFIISFFGLVICYIFPILLIIFTLIFADLNTFISKLSISFLSLSQLILPIFKLWNKFDFSSWNSLRLKISKAIDDDKEIRIIHNNKKNLLILNIVTVDDFKKTRNEIQVLDEYIKIKGKETAIYKNKKEWLEFQIDINLKFIKFTDNYFDETIETFLTYIRKNKIIFKNFLKYAKI
ncbi:unknown transmembrane protein [Mesoplasma florum L1]|uniref:Uncharacterized protein n=1 Tax=Mesoplasma florum (strain ATCC 33453 / NBRC 100688 / NCTC 11704 / L1) TaxID=265311 RepID=Q6F1G6_MESFL|nr:hypothetical protein [Mesoplasma florum]AAT75657.1 unknown transmembrane protein [Mesoplasma florum L1]